MPERKSFLLRLDPAVYDALARWAGDELRSTNAQIDFLLRSSLAEAGRLPASARSPRRRGRPRTDGPPRGSADASRDTNKDGTSKDDAGGAHTHRDDMSGDHTSRDDTSRENVGRTAGE